MFVDQKSARDSLERIIRHLAGNGALRQDLLQEGLIHLWRTEQSRPGQTRSWYLQSCKFHLLHYLMAGKSVDSAKRRGQREEELLEVGGNQEDLADSGDTVVGAVSARDIISLLSRQLTRQETAVLACFAEGFGPREIGRKLKISHTLVIRLRRKMARLLNRLETPRPVLLFNGNGANGSNGMHRVKGPVSGHELVLNGSRPAH